MQKGHETFIIVKLCLPIATSQISRTYNENSKLIILNMNQGRKNFNWTKSGLMLDVANSVLNMVKEEMILQN